MSGVAFSNTGVAFRDPGHLTAVISQWIAGVQGAISAVSAAMAVLSGSISAINTRIAVIA